MTLVSTDWLNENLNKVKIIDASWHLVKNRNAIEEYNKEHIQNAIFFDLDKNSEQNTELPHMLPTKEKWEEIISSLGISNEDKIVIYDNSDVLSSCRGWYNFIYFGHERELVSVLDGGLKKWKIENKITTNEKTNILKSKYIAKENKHLVKNINEINDNIKTNNFKVIDARSRERFEGIVPDPRKNVRSGSIPNSLCLPFKEVINSNDHKIQDAVDFWDMTNKQDWYISELSQLGIQSEKYSNSATIERSPPLMPWLCYVNLVWL